MQIASFVMSACQGRMRRTPLATKTVTRDQLDGVGVLIGNYHAPVCRLVTKAYAANLVAAEAIADGYRALVGTFKTAGTLIAVAEGTGEAWTNVAPLAADPIVSAVISPLGTHVVVCTWDLLPDSVP